MSTYPHALAGEPADAPLPATAEEIAEGRRIRAELAAVELDEPDDRLTATPWRLAGAIEQIRAEADAANPRRDRSSDGTIGNTSHAANWTASDHNPFVIIGGVGVVRAIDVDVDGLDLPAAAERARAGAFAGRIPQLAAGGYVILNRRITAPDFSGWRVYTGPNPHTSHGHFSVSREPFRFDNRQPFRLFESAAIPEESNVKNLVIARLRNQAATFVGDGVNRRWIADAGELAGVQWWIAKNGGDPTVQIVDDIRFLGRDVATPPALDLDKLDVDETALAAAILPGLVAALPPGTLDREDVLAALREFFAAAASTR